MKRLLPILFIAIAALTMGSCNHDYEEFYFKGHVLGVEMCSSTQIGYIMEIESPANVGDTLTYAGTLHHNVVMAYRAPRKLSVNETIYGVAYNYEDFSAYNCILVYYPHLPEMAMLSADEDSTIMNQHN